MMRKGFVERYIEDIGMVLAHFFGVKEKGKAAEAREVIRNASKDLTGLDWNLVQSMGAESLLALLKTNGQLDAGKCLVLGVLLHEQGMMDEEIGLTPVALVEYKKAFRLLGEAMKQDSIVRTQELTARMGDLMRRITANTSTSSEKAGS